MTMKYYYHAQLVLPDQVISGGLLEENNKIAAVIPGDKLRPEDLPEAQCIDLGGNFLAPGFVETHVHGGGLCDFTDGTPQAFETAVRTHLRFGATTICPTLVAAGKEEIVKAIEAFRLAKQNLGNEVTLPGLHLEGPYLSANQKGALDERYIRDPDPAEYRQLVEQADGLIRRWTFAPERKGALEFAEYLLRNHILPSIGHSDAEYSHVQEAFQRGCRLITHLYSATSNMVRRGGFRFPGITESAFCIEGMYAEIIADGCHLPPEILRMVWRLLGPEHVILTCDAIRCAGTDVTESIIGSLENGMPIIIEDEVAKLPDRSAFAGSVATAQRLVRVMHQKANVPLEDCVRMYTLTPAQLIEVDHCKGSLEIGKDADFVCFDSNVQVQGVSTAGYRSGIFAKEN